MTLPRFKAPEPLNGELIENWHRRVIEEFERFVNDQLMPAIATPRFPQPCSEHEYIEPGCSNCGKSS